MAIDNCKEAWAVLKGIEFGTPSYELVYECQRMTGLEEIGR